MMKKMSEGHKMFISVMVIFAIYATFFILFDDYDRKHNLTLIESSDWRLVLFSLLVMTGLGVLLLRYTRRMDHRISRDQADKENQMRRQLTQNIAHELKTPVASILGYAETMLEHPDIDKETRVQFLERTRSQAQRLTSLLQDISTLNRMDYATDMIQMEPTDVSRIVADIIQETSLRAAQRHMSIHNYLPVNIIVNGSKSLIYSIFSNLIDNALKYAGEETAIEIKAQEKGDKWLFAVSDNGTGIAREHLSRIFERFYRIDKGRSRALGGTGLGLAIVKNAVLLHGGDIKAVPTPGGGLTFEFTLKR